MNAERLSNTILRQSLLAIAAAVVSALVLWAFAAQAAATNMTRAALAKRLQRLESVQAGLVDSNGEGAVTIPCGPPSLPALHDFDRDNCNQVQVNHCSLLPMDNRIGLKLLLGHAVCVDPIESAMMPDHWIVQPGTPPPSQS